MHASNNKLDHIIIYCPNCSGWFIANDGKPPVCGYCYISELLTERKKYKNKCKRILRERYKRTLMEVSRETDPFSIKRPTS